MTRPVRARIDLQALQANFQRVREAAPRSRVMAIIKANAYGHGLLRAAGALRAADAFGVAGLEEGIALREAGVAQRILLLEGVFEPDELVVAAHHRLDVAVHHSVQVEMLKQARVETPLTVWVKIDTGMHRLGFPPQAVRAIVQRLRDSTAVAPKLRFFSHLASADETESEATPRQRELFVNTLADMDGERSLANSAGLLAWPDTHFDWVRPGIMLFGVSPFAGKTGADHGLRPVMKVSTALIAINRLRKGDAVGYGAAWVCPEDMPVGVAAIGYGDGYPRHAASGTPVLVNDQRVPLIGRVSMDMLTLDLRSQPDARVGDPVVLWGEGLPVEEVAARAGTIPYELLCHMAPRVAQSENLLPAQDY